MQRLMLFVLSPSRVRHYWRNVSFRVRAAIGTVAGLLLLLLLSYFHEANMFRARDATYRHLGPIPSQLAAAPRQPSWALLVPLYVQQDLHRVADFVELLDDSGSPLFPVTLIFSVESLSSASLLRERL